MVESDMEGESNKKRATHGGEENEDRLSGLPDCVLLHILSFMNTKHAVQTCVLSRRWEDLWKYVPAVLLHSSEFSSVVKFTKFVRKVLSCRDGSTALYNLDFQRCGHVEPYLLKRIVKYAVSHNVQQLRLWISVKENLEFPPTILSCQSLTSLQLSVMKYRTRSTLLFPKSLSLSALINLHLENSTFFPNDDGQAEPFSNCKKLHTLVINDFTVQDGKILSISNARVANLVIRNCNTVDQIVLSTPNLRSFSLSTVYAMKLIGSNFSFLEEVYIDAWPHCLESVLILNSWLQVLSNMKSLTFSLYTHKVLSLIPDLRTVPPPCLGNLKWFKMEVQPCLPEIPSELVDYLLQNSPSAKVMTVNCR